MNAPKYISLQSGEESSITVTDRMIGEIRCISGDAHVVNQRLGIGWNMRAGEGCLLRSATRYRVTARTPVRVAIHAHRPEPQSQPRRASA